MIIFFNHMLQVTSYSFNVRVPTPVSKEMGRTPYTLVKLSMTNYSA